MCVRVGMGGRVLCECVYVWVCVVECYVSVCMCGRVLCECMCVW